VTRSPFDPRLADLPAVLPVFPLTGVLLLPGGRLPLNIFEPRYLALFQDALVAPLRLVGMIQPVAPQAGAGTGDDAIPLYATGCAGRIAQFAETDDGRYLVTLKGVCRFRTGRELELERGYRRVVPDWAPFAADMGETPPLKLDREHLVDALRAFFKAHELNPDWDAIRELPDAALVTQLAMACPFSPGEKQAILECPDGAERVRVLTALIEMSLAGAPGAGARH
jgi:Lon protease-like protein